MADASPLTPSDAFELLLAGNQRFVAGASQHPNQDAARRAETAPGQRPFAVLFGCSDSRLAAEIIFDRGLGDLFVVRTAGHVVGPEVLGSIEYGVRVLDCPLVVVLGHDSCGAVAATRAALADGVGAVGYVRDLIERVTPSVLAARAAGLTQDDDIIAEHIRHTVDLLLDRSRVLADQVTSGLTAVVGLFYRLADGGARLVTARPADPSRRPRPEHLTGMKPVPPRRRRRDAVTGAGAAGRVRRRRVRWWCGGRAGSRDVPWRRGRAGS